MLRPSPLLILLAVLLPAAAGCEGTPEPPLVAENGGMRVEAPVVEAPAEAPDLLDPNRVVARVNDQTITISTLRAHHGRAALQRFEAMTEEDLKAHIDRLTIAVIYDRLTLDAARRLGIEVSAAELEGVRKRVDEQARAERGVSLAEDLAQRGMAMWEWEAEMRRTLVLDKYKRMLLGSRQAISPETRALFDAYVRPSEVRAWYDRNRESLKVTEEVQLMAIFVSFSRHEGEEARARQHAESLVARARGGEAFADLVKEVHGEVPFSMFDEPFDRARSESFTPEVRDFAWTAPPGSVSDPIRLGGGMLILHLVRRREARIPPFEEVREQIEIQIGQRRAWIGERKLKLDLLERSVISPERYKRLTEAALREEIRRLLRED